MTDGGLKKTLYINSINKYQDNYGVNLAQNKNIIQPQL